MDCLKKESEKGFVKRLKERLDVLLVDRKLVDSRQKAKTSIMAGLVFVDNQRVDKAGTKVSKDADIFVKQNPNPYVGRGGLKLQKAVEEFHLQLTNTICCDMGASTGGFTDCMLQHGAKKVYAIDVGYNQLDYRLRVDSRVVSMEKTNIRYLDPQCITDPIDFISIDVSFISLSLILPVAEKLITPSGQIVCLVKPQFEAGREQVGKNGIVRDEDVHRQVIQKVISFGLELNLYPQALTYSPVTGAKGNVEYLLLLGRKQHNFAVEDSVKRAVAASHKELDK